MEKHGFRLDILVHKGFFGMANLVRHRFDRDRNTNCNILFTLIQSIANGMMISTNLLMIQTKKS